MGQLRLLAELVELVEQDVRPQVGQCVRLAGLEAQLVLGQLHDFLVGDGDAVGLANLCDDGRLDEGTGDVQACRGLALLVRLLAGPGLQVLGHHVDVLLGHDDGVARPVQAGVGQVGRLARTAGAAGERPDGKEECSAGGEDTRTCSEASGHGLLLEGTTPEGDMVSQHCWAPTLPPRLRRRTQPSPRCPPARFRPRCTRPRPLCMHYTRSSPNSTRPSCSSGSPAVSGVCGRWWPRSRRRHRPRRRRAEAPRPTARPPRRTAPPRPCGWCPARAPRWCAWPA